MNTLYEQLLNGGSNTVGPPPQVSLTANTYFSYIQTQPMPPPTQSNSFQNNQDFLNSSQTEKNWLNSSLNEKNWLNNSLSLPPEQRSQSLKEMVAKIVDDLEASGNANTLFSFKALASQHHMPPPQPQPFQLQKPTNIQFFRQDSSKDSSLNNSFSGILSPYSLFYPPPYQESQLNKKQNDFNQQINSPRILFNNQAPPFANNYDNLNNKNSNHDNRQSKPSQIEQNHVDIQYQQPQVYQNQFMPPNPITTNNKNSYQSHHQIQQMPNPIFRPPPSTQPQAYMMQPTYASISEAQYYQNLGIQQGLYQTNIDSDKKLKQNNNMTNSQQHLPGNILMSQPNQQNQINYVNLNNISSMPLAFPQSYSHHLATLSPDQQKYLLEQQRALFMKLEAVEMYQNQNQYNVPQRYYPSFTPQQVSITNQEFNKAHSEKNTITNGKAVQSVDQLMYETINNENGFKANQPSIHHIPSFTSLMSSSHSNSTPSSPIVMNSPNTFKTQTSSSSKDSRTVYSPVLAVNKNLTNQNNKINLNDINDKVSNLSISNQNKTFDYQQQQPTAANMGAGFLPKNFHSKYENSHNFNANEANNRVYYNNQHYQGPNYVFPYPFLPPNIPEELKHNITLAQYQKFQIQLPNDLNQNVNNLLENLGDPDSLAQIAMNNEKLRIFSKQPYRQHRRTGPANELHVRLEECLYQFKCLEVERKKIENELYHINVTKKFNQSFNYNPQIPRLPPNPSRVDRLIVESSKEHAKVVNLVNKIENLKDTIFFTNIQQTIKMWLEGIHNVMAKRRDELLNSANRQRMGQPARINDDKDVSILASSINQLSVLTSKTRTALWCALQISNVNYNQQIVLNDKSVINESLFNTIEKTNEFMRKTFEIKTDL